jgi:hypothetical protein
MIAARRAAIPATTNFVHPDKPGTAIANAVSPGVHSSDCLFLRRVGKLAVIFDNI